MGLELSSYRCRQMESVKHPQGDARYVRKELCAVALHITFLHTFFTPSPSSASLVNRDTRPYADPFSGQLRSQPTTTRAAACTPRHISGCSETLYWRSAEHSRPAQPGALGTWPADGGLVTIRRPGVDCGHGHHSGARPRPPPVPCSAPGRDRERQVSPSG